MLPTTTQSVAIPFDVRIGTVTLQKDQPSSPSSQSIDGALSPLSPSSKPVPTDPTCSLFLLPAEIRLQIYIEVVHINLRLTTSSSIVYHCSNVIGSRPHLALLQTCRQIYAEARLVPFESNIFQFYRWYGSSTFECRKFLYGLRSWQIEAIRDVRLGITECEIRGLGTKGAREAFLGICRKFGNGLRNLTLDVDPESVVCGGQICCSQESGDIWWVGSDSQWVTDGLALLKSLKFLHVKTSPDSVMVAASQDGRGDGREICERALKEKLPWCGEVVISLRKK